MSDSMTSKPLALGKFKPLLAGTSLACIGAAALPGKSRHKPRGSMPG